MRPYQLFLAMIATFASGNLFGETPASKPASLGKWLSYRSPEPLDFSQPRVDRVSVDVGAIGLVREVPDSQILAIDENGTELLNADSLQGSMQAGFRTMLDIREVRSWFGGTDLQLGYFGINSLDAGATANANEVYMLFFRALPAEPPTSFAFNYSSNLYSAEANLKFGSRNRIRPIAGLRYFKLEDTYDVFEHVSGGGRDGFFSLTNNSMFGGQFGLEADLYQAKRLNFYGFGKVAAMHNEVEGTATAENGFRNYSDSTYTTLVDAGAGAKYRFAGPLSFTVGYRTLFASDVALGIDQNRALALFGGAGSVQYNSQQWHGLDVGAVFEF